MKAKFSLRKRYIDYKAKTDLANTQEDGEKAEGLDSEEDLLLSTEDQVLFFSTPKQLLEIFAELEENNLALIQNCQETEETLEELRAKILETDAKMYDAVNRYLNTYIGTEKQKI